MVPGDIHYIVVHCSATPNSRDLGFAEIDRMHRDRGWAGCGYHVIIRRDGTIELGRALNRQGAHVGGVGHNHDSWGVCLVGGVDEHNQADGDFTEEQYHSLWQIIKGLKLRAPQAEVLGHRDLSPDTDGDGVVEPQEWLKQCPCFDVRSWWAGID